MKMCKSCAWYDNPRCVFWNMRPRMMDIRSCSEEFISELSRDGIVVRRLGFFENPVVDAKRFFETYERHFEEKPYEI